MKATNLKRLNLNSGGRIIFLRALSTGCEAVDWIQLSFDRDLWFQKMREIL
jgi:hypothetical protein